MKSLKYLVAAYTISSILATAAALMAPRGFGPFLGEWINAQVFFGILTTAFLLIFSIAIWVAK